MNASEDNTGPLAASPPVAGWRAFFPPAQWLARYQARWLRHDIVAGVTLAAYAIPVSLAYATLAGLPPQTGIYCYLVAGPAYALFGSSRQLAIGPTSAISMLVGTTLLGMAEGDPQRWAAIAALTALIFASMSIVAWLLKLSSLVSFISETILLGFKAGAALTIAMTQLPKLFGVKGGGDHFFERVLILGNQLGDTNVAVLLFGLAAIALLVTGEKLFPGRPVALFVVAASIVALSVTPLAHLGFSTVGALPAGLPHPALPSLRARDADGVIPLAFACFLLAYIEGVSAARALAQRHGYEIDARQELLALGAANVAAAIGQSYPVAGGLSQSTVNDKAGAKTALALVFASLAIGICLVFLTRLLENLPNVVLAAIVLVAVKGLINIPELRRVWKLSHMEFWVAMAAFAGVLLLGILKGVLLAAVVSMLLLIRRAAQPHVARLGRVPGTPRYSDVERNPDNEAVPGVLILRVESGLFYFNIDHVRDRVRQHIAAAGEGLRLVVWDLSSSSYVDIAGTRMLGELQRELAERGVTLRLVEARANVRDLVRAEIGPSIGEVTRRVSIDDAIRAEGLAPAGGASVARLTTSNENLLGRT
ncbi:MAG TPA: SulP family inorganic anion transporter [Casimicrobiaceae bacterium]|nr:SulP family inorganic anion transporter [Casimicrobiaceae bacterium]